MCKNHTHSPARMRGVLQWMNGLSMFPLWKSGRGCHGTRMLMHRQMRHAFPDNVRGTCHCWRPTAT